MGIIELDGVELGKVIHGAVALHVGAGDLRKGGADKEILLPQPQLLALLVVIVGVEDLADGLGTGGFTEGAQVVAVIEALHIDAGALRLPQPQNADCIGIVAGNVHIVGHRQHRFVVDVLLHQVALVPVLLQPAAEFDLDGVLLIGAQPYLAAGQPVIGQLGLGAVHQLLLKDAVFIEDGIAGAVVAVGGHAVQIAGGKTTQTAVAETGVRLAGIQALRGGAEGGKRLGEGLHQPQIIKTVFEALAHQKFHGKIMDTLFLFLGGLLPVGAALFHHDITQHQCGGLVELVIGGQLGLYLHQVFQLVFHRLADLLCGHIEVLLFLILNGSSYAIIAASPAVFNRSPQMFVIFSSIPFPAQKLFAAPAFCGIMRIEICCRRYIMSRYKINIMEHQYYINTDRDPAWVKMLQERLNGQIDEIREGCPNLSAFDTFALLTMNLMDQLAKSEEAAANLRQQLTNYLRESSAVRAPGDDYRRAGQMDFRDYDENDEEF